MSFILTRNTALRERWRDLKKIHPETGTQWEKFYLPKTERDNKLYGWYHNAPYHNWNNKAFFAFEKTAIRDTVVSNIFKTRQLSRFADLIKMCEDSVLHELSTPGPWTVFAPVDSAFDRLVGGWNKFKSRAELDNLKLRMFLRRHVSSGPQKLRGISGSVLRLNSLDGVTIELVESGTFENHDRQIHAGLDGSSMKNALVKDYDKRASNGYVHIIDAVLALPAKTIPAT